MFLLKHFIRLRVERLARVFGIEKGDCPPSRYRAVLDATTNIGLFVLAKKTKESEGTGEASPI